MKITHNIKLSSGKEIELTEEEYKELKQEFKVVEAVPCYPYYPYYSVYPNPNIHWNNTLVLYGTG